MERITDRVVVHGHTVLRYVGSHKRCPEGDTPAEVNSHGVLELLKRLAEYEDTWLEPGALRWIPVTEQLPPEGYFVPVIVTGRYGNIKWDRAVQLAEYWTEDGWILEDWPEATEIAVSHWFELPELPGEE